MPHSRALLLAERAGDLPYVDPGLIADVAARLRELAGVDPLVGGDAAAACVHGDAHLGNVLWRDGRVVALLDFEWVRLGPPDLELEPHLRDVRPDNPRDEAEVRQLFGWLAETHPAAFAPPDLVARLWLYELTFALRRVLIGAGDRIGNPAGFEYPLRLLRHLVDGPAHLHRLLPP